MKTIRVVQRRVVSELVPTTVEGMDKLLSDEKSKNLIGIPVYYDANKRVWPNPAEGFSVEFGDEDT